MSTPAETINAMERLTREIERVAVLRERYRAISLEAFSVRANFGPAIQLMTAALEAAHQAAGSGDVLAIIRILRDLQAFEE
jgi:hypothetical protein